MLHSEKKVRRRIFVPKMGPDEQENGEDYVMTFTIHAVTWYYYYFFSVALHSLKDFGRLTYEEVS
jgi:hypothetical protein